ncbi:HD domain-containing protein [Phormidium sp. CCY1219]|uniref:HD domain-containing protein n=1 Tax=Phormidium sp. CCY1219 TaxID=2886104 RepID=UPI002D1EB73F|nr:hypothetical protein [Phormidium sp. CCY1219]MEB3829526.1 hypothetical protein [Phormidium sp. CCY1219]
MGRLIRYIMGYVDGLGLKSSWDSLLHPFQVPPKVGKKILFELVSTYCSKDRHYHNLGHVQRVLDMVEDLQPLAQDLTAIQFAAWFHDAIYDTTARDNEEKSAEYAEKCLTQLQIPRSTIDAVTRMILHTQHHQVAAHDIDSQILIDADLSILGAEDADYQFYANGIKREYSWVSDAEYCQGRMQVLQQLLQRDKIYYTKPMLERYEENARRNMLWEIGRLQEGEFC